MKEKLSAIGGVLTAILAASCCIGPALFLVFGITGLGFLSRFEWLRPYMLILTVGFVGIAYHYAYGRGAGKCSEDGKCNPKAMRVNRIIFWIVVGFAVFGFSFPYVLGWIYA